MTNFRHYHRQKGTNPTYGFSIAFHNMRGGLRHSTKTVDVYWGMWVFVFFWGGK